MENEPGMIVVDGSNVIRAGRRSDIREEQIKRLRKRLRRHENPHTPRPTFLDPAFNHQTIPPFKNLLSEKLKNEENIYFVNYWRIGSRRRAEILGFYKVALS